jgi:hypothetical protein
MPSLREFGRFRINSFEVELEFGATIYRHSLSESELQVTVVAKHQGRNGRSPLAGV